MITSPISSAPLRAGLLISIAGTIAACSTGSISPEQPLPTRAPDGMEDREVHLSGCFQTIWNGDAKYMLIDERGRWTRLLLDPSLTQPLGGPLGLNRKRVKVVGRLATDQEATVRVLIIELEGDDVPACAP